MCGATELLDLPAPVLCHDTAPDPLIVYVNRTAQGLWCRDLDEFVGLPSRLTADPAKRAERAAALAAPGVVRGYRGERVTASGEQFWIRDATVWPVFEYSGSGGARRLAGQAATFGSWGFVGRQ